MRGRPPKPTALKILTGNPGKRPLDKSKIGAKFPFPKAPKGMGKYGLQFWNKAGKLAHKFGIIKETDISILVMTCHCYDRLERAREVLGEKLLEDGQFGEKKHPLLLIIQQEEDRLSKHLQQMGLTPVARERVTFSLPDKDNPFAEFINPSEDDVFAQLMASQGH